jgi:TIR domain
MIGRSWGDEFYDVFVSYSRADWRHAVEIDSALRARGLKPFFDRRNLLPGLRWVRALEEAIGACKAAIVLIGPHGFGNTQQYERDLAFYRQTRDPAFPIVPVLLPEAGLDGSEFFSGRETLAPATLSRISESATIFYRS